MIGDVWRAGELVLYCGEGLGKGTKMVCRVLCQEWAGLGEGRYRLADGLMEIRKEF